MYSKTSQILEKIAYLEETQIDLTKLEEILVDIFKKNPNILEEPDTTYIKSNLRRAIRIYDYLKYGNAVKELSKI